MRIACAVAANVADDVALRTLRTIFCLIFNYSWRQSQQQQHVYGLVATRQVPLVEHTSGNNTHWLLLTSAIHDRQRISKQYIDATKIIQQQQQQQGRRI